MKVLPAMQKQLEFFTKLGISSINHINIFLKIAELDGNVQRAHLKHLFKKPNRLIDRAVEKLINLELIVEEPGKKNINLYLTSKGEQFVRTILHVTNNHEEKGKYGFCAKCGKFKLLKCHHFLPRVDFGENPFLVMLCCKCHKLADSLVVEKSYSREQCFSIICDFVEQP